MRPKKLPKESRIATYESLITVVHGFGYHSNKEVKMQFNGCMFNGEVHSICDTLCLKDSIDGDPQHHGTFNEGILEKKCDECRNWLQQLEEHCLKNLYSNEFFWN